VGALARRGAVSNLYRILRMEDIAWVKPLPLDGDEHVFPDDVL
jgi:uncharacterized protein (DUF952 family)